MKPIVVVAIVLCLAVLAVPSVMAQSVGPKVIKPDSVVFGRTYSEWSAAWEQWAYSIPVSQHPLFDKGDCSVGQSGPVWFLGGKFCEPGVACSYTGVVRTCNVPTGKALYFPVFNYEDSALEESVAENPGNEAYQQIATLRSITYTGQDPVAVACTVDGAAISQLRERFRVESTTFGFTIPTDNYLNAVYGTNSFLAGSYFPAVDDGYYVMLSPLPAGRHVVHFQGVNTSTGFALDVTYNLNVAK